MYKTNCSEWLIKSHVFLTVFTIILFAMSSFKISSLNLNGARYVKKRTMYYDLLKTKCIDIAFAQETHSSIDNEVDWKKEWEGNIVFSHMSNVSAGVAILFSKGFLPVSYEVEDIVKGRLLKVVAFTHGKIFGKNRDSQHSKWP